PDEGRRGGDAGKGGHECRRALFLRSDGSASHRSQKFRRQRFIMYRRAERLHHGGTWRAAVLPSDVNQFFAVLRNMTRSFKAPLQSQETLELHPFGKPNDPHEHGSNDEQSEDNEPWP